MTVNSVKLTEICRPKQWPTISKTELKESGYPVFGANGQIGFYERFTHSQATILITCRGATCGTINICTPFSYVTGNAMALDNLDEARVHQSYLARYLRHRGLADTISGSAQPQITRQTLDLVRIPLPPLDEQRRIAAILDQADALRDKRRQALAQVEQLTQSVFLEMFGSDPAKWRNLPVEAVAAPGKASIRTGPFGSQLLHSEFVDDGIPVLGIDNVVTNQFVYGGGRHVTEGKFAELRRYQVFPGDVLITIMGTCGRCAVVPDDIGIAVNTKHLCCITLAESLCQPAYFHYCFLLHPAVQKALGVEARGAVMPGLNMGIIKSLLLPVPPLELQQKFARRVEAIERLKDAHRRSLEEMDALFASLQHRAFRGEL